MSKNENHTRITNFIIDSPSHYGGGGVVGSSNSSVLFIILLTLLFVVVLSAGNTAEAGVQDFSIVNYSGRTIYKLYVSRSDHSIWEEDILGDSILSHGNFIKIRFPPEERGRFWDIKVTFRDGHSWRWSGIDLTGTDRIIIDGKGTIHLG